MENLLKGRVRPSLVGLLQSVAVASYCAIVGGFMFYISRTTAAPGYLGIFLMLVLFVFSAAVTGTLVFGLPVYFALNKKTKEALSILGHTLFYILLIIAFTAVAVFLAGHSQRPTSIG